MDAPLKNDYAEKKEDYFEQIRSEMLPLLPRSAHRILDIGCGAGAFGSHLRKHLGREVWGIEPDARAAKKAASHLDRVLAEPLTNSSALPKNYFDCVFFNDVLEHLVDPWESLRLVKTSLKQDGIVIASIPNVRHFPTLWRLAFRAEWTYAERGILDKTHLRFFTRQTIENIFHETGYKIISIEGINERAVLGAGDTRLWQYYKLLSLIPSKTLTDAKFLQFAVVAKPVNNTA
ncbi:MAG: class I SAM-dependent methyltransferase [Opitutaceae bacterium]|nr:class I SAM-dependent methyltransferase [Opitutaceae bacterium]